MRALLKLLPYLGVGALCHALVLGPTFDFGSAWTWAWLLAWPAALFVSFSTVALVLIALFLVGLAIFEIIRIVRAKRRRKELRPKGFHR